MIRKLVQYGGYVISGILITWLINPTTAIAFLEVIFKISLLIGIPVLGAYLLNRIILLKHIRVWNIIMPLWIMVSIYFSFRLIKLLDNFIN